MTLILALETSCDETSAALVRDGRTVVSSVVSSQVDLHRAYGGIVPEVASREHVLKIVPVLQEAVAALENPAGEVDAVAVTHGPGLAGSLLVGVNVAKALALAWDKPLLAVHHLEAHLYANWLSDQGGFEPPRFPCLCLVISGGHTSLIVMRDHGQYEQIGQTLDDAAGEAFDKAARILGLGYPGGPVIEQAARQGQPQRYKLPRSSLKGTHDFSFSGIKTALYRLAQEERRRESSLHYGAEQEGRPGEVPRLSRAGEFPPLSPQVTADLAASFQEAVVDILVRKTTEAANIHGVLEVLLAGGVAANTRLREEMALHVNVPLRIPPPALCTDNAAMVGAAAYYHLLRGKTAGWDLDVYPNLSLV